MSLGKLLVIAAPSGVGKTSLIRALMAQDPRVGVTISHTTRPRRSAEQDGTHYHFVSQATFDTLEKSGEMIETAAIFGYCYGTSWQALQEAQRKYPLVILEIDWQGANSVRERDLDNVSVFIFPPSKDEQVKRLQTRDQDSEEVIERRVKQTHDDCMHWKEFPYHIINDDFERALEQLQGICNALLEDTPIVLPDVTDHIQSLIVDLRESLSQ